MGGPASGLWPSGGNAGQPASGPTPTPTPPSSCVTPSLFADCFAMCLGTIDGVTPGPICGWTFSMPFGPLGGSITFTPGSMSFNTTAPGDFPGDNKSLSAPLPTVNGITGQFSFTEYPTPPTVNTSYEIVITNQDLSEAVFVALFGDGTAAIQVGDPAASSNYTGTWTPTPGGTHDVHFSVSALGVPTLYIDGVVMALTFVGISPSFSSLLPANTVSFFLGSGDAAATTAPVQDVFVTDGILAPNTVFCCP